jgi:hypothetical protein
MGNLISKLEFNYTIKRHLSDGSLLDPVWSFQQKRGRTSHAIKGFSENKLHAL